MTTEGLSAADRELIDAATDAIRKQYKPGLERTTRTVGAALRTESGEVYTGVNLTTATPRASVCAEPIAVGAAVTAGDVGFDTIVSVKYRPETDPRATEAAAERAGGGEDNPERTSEMERAADSDPEVVVISPCGVCRELIRDYDPSTRVVVAAEDGLATVPVTELLPSMVWRDGGPP